MQRVRVSSIVALLAFLPTMTSCARHEDPVVAKQEPAPIGTPSTPDATVLAPPEPDRPTVVRPAPPEIALAWVRANSCADAGPLSLTASDGTGLRLVSFDADAVVEGPLAYTELRLSFDNPEARQLEGRFSIQLPPGAALSRFAMAIGDKWQEGEVVERQAARVAYEDFLHRKQDPALLENGAGNRFEARVFPIAPNARKQLVIGWSQALGSASEPYVLPVCGLPELENLDVKVLVRAPNDGAEAVLHQVELHEKKYTPKMDLELRTGNHPAPILRAGDLAVARVVPAIAAGSESLDELTVLFDTSASRALDFTGQVDRLGALLAELGRRKADTTLRVIAFDQSAQQIYDGPISGFGAAQLDAIRQRGALGASDLGVGLAAISKAARVLYVGDGVFTAGASERGAAIEQLKTLAAERGIGRFDALIDGGLQDRALLEDLARGELERDGIVLDARVSVGQLADKIERPTRSGLKVAVEGASWWWPQVVDGVQPGDAVLVYAELPADRALQVSIGDAAISEEGSQVATAPRPLLQRARAQAKIEQLTGELAALGSDVAGTQGDRIRGEIVGLSTSQRVLSDYTALLVLESEDDYRRFGIERSAMGEVMTVGDAGIEVIARGGLPVATLDKSMTPMEVSGDKEKQKFADADRPKPDESSNLDGGGGNRHAGEEGTMGTPTARGSVAAADPAPPGDVQLRLDAPSPEPAVAEEADAERSATLPRRRAASPAPTSRPHGGELDDALMDSGTERTDENPMPSDPYDGDLKPIMAEIAAGNLDHALELARAWRARAPGDVLALVGLGKAMQAKGDLLGAARAYGSIIDLFPSRTDLRRMAGEQLESLGTEGAALALDTYAKAVAQRPDHPSSHRLYAFALLRAGKHEEAFNAIIAGLDREYPGGRFAEVQRILREDLGLIAAAWLAADPGREPTIARAVGERHASIDNRASIRFVLNWETDANDVDLHVFDGKKGHAFFRSKSLPSGGELYADVTTGYGPECFAIQDKATAFPYTIQAHYYARGPMGYGMGKLEVIEHDGAGHLSFVEQPFVLMKDNSYVDLVELKERPSLDKGMPVEPRGRLKSR
jgi:tetratricopeptide (TPR) repeat protein